jgi:uncharacterized protein HemY
MTPHEEFAAGYIEARKLLIRHIAYIESGNAEEWRSMLPQLKREQAFLQEIIARLQAQAAHA